MIWRGWYAPAHAHTCKFKTFDIYIDLLANGYCQNIQETLQVMKFKTTSMGVVPSKLLLSGVKVQLNQLPDNLASSEAVNKHNHAQTLMN